LDVHIRPLGRAFATTNDQDGYSEIAQAVAEFNVRKIIMEASGGYETQVLLSLVEHGLPVSVVNPRQVRLFARGGGRSAKTDSIDAAMLAYFAEVFQPRETVPPSALETQLNEYVLYRRYLVREVIALKNQLRRLTVPALRKALRARLQVVERDQKGIEAAMVKLTVQSEKAQLYQLLTSVPGVGPLLACMLIANLRELGSLSRRQIASLVGVAPMNNDSGQRRGYRFITGGRGAIRTVLYMSTLAASRYNKPIRDFYQRLRAAGKRPKVALTACMRKLLTIAHDRVEHGQ
jgi:transposase